MGAYDRPTNDAPVHWRNLQIHVSQTTSSVLLFYNLPKLAIVNLDPHGGISKLNVASGQKWLR